MAQELNVLTVTKKHPVTVVKFLEFLKGAPQFELSVLLITLSILVNSAGVFPPLDNSDHVLASVSIDFPSSSQCNPPFHCAALSFSYANWVDVPDHLWDVPWKDIFYLSASTAASKFCDRINLPCLRLGSDRLVTISSNLPNLFSLICQMYLC